MVVVTGPTGSGKSTTLAAIIDEANRKRKDHIITIEDPIEFVHQSKSCIVNHREVNTHTKNFTSALGPPCARTPTSSWWAKCATSKRIRLAIEAAATGHLVFSTLHTTAPQDG